MPLLSRCGEVLQMKTGIALGLTILTGFTGLVYEVAWQRYLATLLGSDSEATAAVLAIFLGGLSIGYSLFGRVTERLVSRSRTRKRPLRLLLLYAAVEALIGLYALVFPQLFDAVQGLSLALPGMSSGLAFFFDVLLAVLLILFPSILMGGTIPILTLALSRDLNVATRIHAWVYGLNTVGAFAGALMAGFFLIPTLGLDEVLWLMGWLNLAAGFVFAMLDRTGLQSSDAVTLDAATVSPGPAKIEGYSALIVVAALSGFSMMTIQTLLNRIGALALGASVFTFAMVVAVFVLSIALGSLAVSLLSRIPRWLVVGSQWLLVIYLIFLYEWIPNTPYYAHVIRSLFQPTDAGFYAFQAFVFAALFLFLLIPVGLSGALLPLLFHHLRQSVGDLGATAGRLYSWNTVGSLLGALLGGYLLFLFFDLHAVYRIALAGLILASAILSALVLRISWVAISLLVVIPALAGLLIMPAWDSERLASGLFRKREATANTYLGADALFEARNRRIVFHRDGPSATATVRKNLPSDEVPGYSISTNGKPDGHLIGDYPTMALAALIPALIADDPQRSFVIGYGTGVTAGELAALDSMKEVHVAEISDAVMDAAPFFEAGNQAALANEKVEIFRSDAYRSLRRAEGTYDIIVSEPSNPWVSGVELLFSREFLEAANEKLTEGGVYAQWFHLYEMDSEALNLVFRTYLSVFDHVSVWYTMQSDVLILGIKNPRRALNLAALGRRFEQPDFRAGFARAEIPNLASVLAHEIIPLGVLRREAFEGPIQTLRHPRLGYLAAKAFYRGQVAELPPFLHKRNIEQAARTSLLRRTLDASQSRQAVLAAAAIENCRVVIGEQCATWMARWAYEYPDSPARLQALEKLRKTSKASAHLNAQNLQRLTSFFDKNPLQSSPARSLAMSRRETGRYLKHFNVVAPFERSALEEIWRACDTPPCEEARRELEARVGPLSMHPAHRKEASE